MDYRTHNLEVLRKIQVQQKKLNQMFLDEFATDVLLEIIRLTNKGLNAYNRPFQSYSSSYIDFRIEEGLTTFPNMQLTSRMINSFVIRKPKNMKRTIGPVGSSYNYKKTRMIKNALKLAYVQKKKNYIILAWTPHFKKLLDKHFKRYQKRWNNLSF